MSSFDTQMPLIRHFESRVSASIKLFLLLLLCVTSLAHAADPEVVIHRCDCEECDIAVKSGGCVAGSESSTSMRVTCLPGNAKCAQLLVYSNATCEVPLVAGQSAICDRCSDMHRGYSFMKCNPETNDAELRSSCDSTCSQCTGTVYNYPYKSCSSHAGGNMGMYNQGLFQCDGVSIEEFATSDCSGSPVATYSRAANDGCTVNQMTFSCRRPPQSHVATPPAGNTVMYAKCPMNSTHCGNECQSTSVKTETCVENPTPSRSKYIEMSCGETAATCATFAVSTGKSCSAFVGKERHACGTCAPWFGGNVYTKLVCDTENGVIDASFGCNSDCSVCTDAINKRVKELDCFGHESQFYSYSLNFQGFESCSTVEVREFGDDSGCQAMSARYPIVRDECELFHSATCVAEPGKAKLSGGAIAGIVIGCVVFLVVIFAVVTCCIRSRKSGNATGKKNGVVHAETSPYK